MVSFIYTVAKGSVKGAKFIKNLFNVRILVSKVMYADLPLVLE